MKEVGAYEAKTHLADLLERAAHGETIVVTRRGKPIAKIVPYSPERLPINTIEAEFARLRQSLPRGDGTLRDLIEEGRRF